MNSSIQKSAIQIEAALDLLRKASEKLEKASFESKNPSLFIVRGDYRHLAIEIHAVANTPGGGREKWQSFAELADKWTERVGWDVDPVSLYKQYVKVSEKYADEIERRTRQLEA